MQKTFDLGIYQFNRVTGGASCPPDDNKVKPGEMLAVLLPMTEADANSLCCFAINGAGRVFKLSKSNLKFKKTVSLPIELHQHSHYHEQIHAKLSIAQKHLQTQIQLSL